MNWKNIEVPKGSKLFKLHRFTYIHKGVHYAIEVDEYADGVSTAHGEHATDRNYVLESVSANTTDECLQQMLKNIEMRAE